MNTSIKPLILTVLFFGFYQISFSQESRFFMPLEIQQAYENGTRAKNGAPGSKYWQNTVDYTLEVSVDPANHTIEGSGEITYYNNSPDNLPRLVIRLYNDVFKKGNTRARPVNPEDVGDGVEVSKLSVNGEEYNLDIPQQVNRFGTNMFVNLQEPVESGGKVTVSVEWSQQITNTNERTGLYDSTSFMIAYWYPQMAVYDDVFGWDQLNYSLQQEFYNNLGNYDVKITAPTNFTVWATGVLQNPGDIYTDAILERFNKAKTSTESVQVLDTDDLTDDFAHKSGTWHFKAEEVSDFAFAMSDHYLWQAASQKVQNRDVLINVAYPVDQAPAYGRIMDIHQRTMKHFSEDFPGIPYPYPTFSTFIGLFGGGMEYPMMANNDGPGRGVTIHEMFHTYFPMYVRINERRFAWMDEGWADFTTGLVTQRYFEDNWEPTFGNYQSGVQSTIGSISDLPLITSSQFMDNSNYGYASYPLPAFFYATLNHYLGDEVFTKCLRTYIQRWAKKSPTPYDFFYTFEDVSGEDLSWLWKPWFFSYGYPEVQVQSYSNGKMSVINTGNRPVPLSIEILYKDEDPQKITRNAKVWSSGKPVKVKIPNYKNVELIKVNGNVPDADIMNNFSPSLKEVVAQKGIPQTIAGRYQFVQYPVIGELYWDDGILKFKVEGAGLDTSLFPNSATELQSLDGQLKITMQREDGNYKSLQMQIQGLNLTANRME